MYNLTLDSRVIQQKYKGADREGGHGREQEGGRPEDWRGEGDNIRANITFQKWTPLKILPESGSIP